MAGLTEHKEQFSKFIDSSSEVSIMEEVDGKNLPTELSVQLETLAITIKAETKVSFNSATRPPKYSQRRLIIAFDEDLSSKYQLHLYLYIGGSISDHAHANAWKPL